MSSKPRTRIKSIGFQLKTLSLAVASALLAINAHAAGLGDLTVQSYLGQPLRAEVELITMPGDSDAPLTVRLAPYDAFQKANIEFSAILHSLRFTTEQRGSKRVVRISSTQPVNEPFVDMLIEVRSNNNTVIREYVFLLDPASLSHVPAVASADNADDKAGASTATRALHAQADTTPAPARRAPPAAAPSQGKPPAAQAAPAKAAPAASAGKPRLTLSSPRAVAGEEDMARAAKEYAAMEQAVAEANARVIALEQRVADMQKLLQVTNSLLAEMQKQKELERAGMAPSAPAIAAAASPAPAATDAASAAPGSEVKAPAAQASVPAPAPAPAPALATPKAAAAPQPAVAPAESDWGGDLLLIPGVALLLAGLSAVGLQVLRRRKQPKSPDDSLFAESALTAHSERRPGAMPATGMNSLLPSSANSDEVDVVAEADVYIAYGRDGQAEELLKEALQAKPGNRAMSMKLLTIYAARKDRGSFELLAQELHRATNGEGDDWAEVVEMGLGIDPDNALYTVKKQANAPAADKVVRPSIILEEAGAPAGELPAPLLEMDLEQADGSDQSEEPPRSTELTEEEKQLAELLSHPLLQEEQPSEDAVAASDDMDVDLAMKQLDEPVFQVAALAADTQAEAAIGPIDFDVIVPDAQQAQAEEKDAAVPELPSEALGMPKATGNLIEFDFLKPVESGEEVSDELPEIPMSVPMATVETAETAEEEGVFRLEFVEDDAPVLEKKQG